MRALVVLAVTIPLTLVFIMAMRTLKSIQRQENAPSKDLATAIRLLDKAATCDEVMPYMSSDVREEVQQFLGRYREREINP